MPAQRAWDRRHLSCASYTVPRTQFRRCLSGQRGSRRSNKLSAFAIAGICCGCPAGWCVTTTSAPQAHDAACRAPAHEGCLRCCNISRAALTHSIIARSRRPLLFSHSASGAMRHDAATAALPHPPSLQSLHEPLSFLLFREIGVGQRQPQDVVADGCEPLRRIREHGGYLPRKSRASAPGQQNT